MKRSTKVISRIKAVLVAVALIISGTAYAAEWVDISGTVLYDGSPVCAMALANGQYMFTCAGEGEYELEVPLDENGEITLYGFCSGLAPFKQVLTPQEAVDFTINMESAPPDSKHMTLTHELTPAEESGWVTISGTVLYDGTPVCAMVLANGQYMFSCAGEGEYELVVPLDGNGKITLYGFCNGLAPYKQIVEGEAECTLEVTDWAPKEYIESTLPIISATFRSTCGADIDVSSIEMIFDDDPVTPTISGSGSEVTVTYRPDEKLPMERNYEVTVRARDVNGVGEEKTWVFFIPWFY